MSSALRANTVSVEQCVKTGSVIEAAAALLSTHVAFMDYIVVTVSHLHLITGAMYKKQEKVDHTVTSQKESPGLIPG